MSEESGANPCDHQALVGFLISLTPLSNDLMNWRGAQAGSGSASIGAYFFFGGLLMILGGVGEVRLVDELHGCASPR